LRAEFKDIWGCEEGRFGKRLNRFIAYIEIDGKIEICHVKNTGRCKELLLEGAKVFVQENNNSNRKTKYSLISVYKGQRLINIDSQAPNRIFYEWLLMGNLFENVTLIKPEYKYKSSRFDFYIEADEKKIFLEVKGVTLEERGVVMFPDAPTERGLKHLNELAAGLDEGYEAYVCFVVQMKDVLYFTPNYQTHEAFGKTLEKINKKGVNIIAFDCHVTKNSIRSGESVDIIL
jgi:sugar fermentation stimulation protein A